MAVVQCKECGGQVSTKAKACPGCGAAAPKRTSAVTWLALFAVVVVSLNMMLRDKAPPTPERPPISEEQRELNRKSVEQYVLMERAKKAVKASLKDPESAIFGESFFREPGYVCGYVNAKNSFGGFTGNKAYLVDTKGGLILIQDSSDGFAEAWGKHCT